MKEDKWSNHVLKNHNTFVANSIDAIAEVFPDYELIQSLGCESVLNLPIVAKNKTVGTVNFLHEANYYTEKHIAAAELLKTPGLNCFLLEKFISPIEEEANG